MRLAELKPEIVNKGLDRPFLSFYCPVCKKHRIEIPLLPTPKGWEVTGGTWDNLTTHPSIAHEAYPDGLRCNSHFFIRKGEIEIV